MPQKFDKTVVLLENNRKLKKEMQKKNYGSISFCGFRIK